MDPDQFEFNLNEEGDHQTEEHHNEEDVKEKENSAVEELQEETEKTTEVVSESAALVSVTELDLGSVGSDKKEVGTIEGEPATPPVTEFDTDIEAATITSGETHEEDTKDISLREQQDIDKIENIEALDEIPAELTRVSLKESVTEVEERKVEQEMEEIQRKRSSRRSTRISQDLMAYDFTSRMPTEDVPEVTRVSGDFTPAAQDHMGLLFSFAGMEEVFEEERQDFFKVEYPPPKKEIETNKGFYITKYESLQDALIPLKVRNVILQRCIGMYMRKHRMDSMLKETDSHPETLLKYQNKLEEMDERLKKYEYRENGINNELRNIQMRKEKKHEQLTKAFEDLQLVELEVAKGATYSKTGVCLPERIVTTRINRQKNQFSQICEMRRQFHNLRYVVKQKENEIGKLNEVGNGLYLFNYEVLKNENRVFLDKIEEKDEELNNLRSKSKKLMQMLAHVREKCSAMDSDIDDLQFDIYRCEAEIDSKRRTLNFIKQERDSLRLQLQNLKIETGLLSENALLKDMEKSIEELKLSKIELKNLQDTYALITKQLRNLRKTRERMELSRKTPDFKIEGRKRKKPASKVCKSTPSSLFLPTIPSTTLLHLKDFTPAVIKLSKN